VQQTVIFSSLEEGSNLLVTDAYQKGMYSSKVNPILTQAPDVNSLSANIRNSSLGCHVHVICFLLLAAVK